MKWLILIFCLLMLGCGFGYWYYFGSLHGEPVAAVAFVEAYGEYNEHADQVEKLVHAPSAGNNPARQELLTLLNAILTTDMSEEDREDLARVAFANLDTLKREVDAAQTAQSKLYESLAGLDDASRTFRAYMFAEEARAIVDLARRRAELSTQITSNLSETGNHTYAIITRVIEEKGVLTESHIVDINAATDGAEKRFEQLNQLYRDLGDVRDELNARFTVFVQQAL